MQCSWGYNMKWTSEQIKAKTDFSFKITFYSIKSKY